MLEDLRPETPYTRSRVHLPADLLNLFLGRTTLTSVIQSYRPQADDCGVTVIRAKRKRRFLREGWARGAGHTPDPPK